MCQECNCEEERIAYDFTYINQYGETNHICKNEILFDDTEELERLIDGFVNLLHISGFSWVEDLIVVKED